jgi:ubiquitin-protein ligase
VLSGLLVTRRFLGRAEAMLLFQNLRSREQQKGPRNKAELRVQKDLSELSSSRFSANSDTRITFPLGSNNTLDFNCLICPHEGLYTGGQFLFSFKIPSDYPFSPPTIRCLTKVPLLYYLCAVESVLTTPDPTLPYPPLLC